jgi:hypothetical protein
VGEKGRMNSDVSSIPAKMPVRDTSNA